MMRHSNWKEETYYLKSSFFPTKQVSVGDKTLTVGKVLDNWYLKYNHQYCKIPHYLAHSLLGQNRFTFWLGPYAFVNEFETTNEGKYLIDMLQYSQLSNAAQRKVDNILKTYKFWVQVDDQMIEILKQRDMPKRNRKVDYEEELLKYDENSLEAQRLRVKIAQQRNKDNAACTKDNAACTKEEENGEEDDF